MLSNQVRSNSKQIYFGTDGWRGVLGIDFTLERLLPVVVAASQELIFQAPKKLVSKKIIIGYDRRFLASDFAQMIAGAVKACDLEPLLTETSVPTPACSFAVVNHQALGALIITASHNPPEWLGIKIKGPFGGSVHGDFTKAVEKRLIAGGFTPPVDCSPKKFDCRGEYLNCLKNKFDLNALAIGIKCLGLKVFVDSMHGSASCCMKELIDPEGEGLVEEINQNRDPLFGGNPPEPLPKYLTKLFETVNASVREGKPAIGIIFDGDGDRIAAVDETGRFCSTQSLMPLFIDHLVRVRKLPGKILKTVSGSDLMNCMAEEFEREIIEMPVGFKYIASEMLKSNVVVGGEESGGVGFGIHLPERDALYAALMLLEALIEGNKSLGDRLNLLEEKFGKTFFDRVDIGLSDMNSRRKLEDFINQTPPNYVAGRNVQKTIRIDGLKLRIDKQYWLMFRFSGTEPLLRIYCEAPNKDLVDKTLNWAKNYIANYE